MGTRPQAREVAPRLVWEGERITCASVADFSVSLRPTDEELIAAVRANDSTALETLFDRFSRLFMGIGLRILGDYGEAEDLVQEVFVYLHQKAALYDPEKGPANKWIVQVAYHRALYRGRQIWTGKSVPSSAAPNSKKPSQISPNASGEHLSCSISRGWICMRSA